MSTDEPGTDPLAAPPQALKARGEVDGWTIPLDDRSGGLARSGMLIAGLAVFGVVTAAMIVLATALSAAALIGLGVLGVIVFAGAMIAMNLRRKPGTLQITPTHLVLERKGERRRIPWSQVSAPRRLADARDTWTQAFQATMDLPDPDAPIRQEKTPGVVVVRWTADGRPAEFAPEHTEWEYLRIAYGKPGAAHRWLLAAIETARAADAERRRNANFDEAVSGGAGEKAHAALQDLMKGGGS